MIPKWHFLWLFNRVVEEKMFFLDMVSTVSASFKSGNLNEMSGKQG